jgi:hypothetical protein
LERNVVRAGACHDDFVTSLELGGYRRTPPAVLGKRFVVKPPSVRRSIRTALGRDQQDDHG